MKFWEHIPPLKAMLAVEATARFGSFSKAACELNVTQSAVSHLVGQAEAFLNTQLFLRQSRPVQLTPDFGFCRASRNSMTCTLISRSMS